MWKKLAKKLFVLSLSIMLTALAWGDATSRPISNVNSAWDENDYQDIDDVVFAPNAGDGVFIQADKNDDDETQSYNLADPGIDAKQLIQYIRGRKVDEPDLLVVNLKIAGNSEANWDINFTTDFEWYSNTFTGSWSTSDFATGFQSDFTVGNMSTNDRIQIDVVYVDVSSPGVYMEGGTYDGGRYGI